MGLFWQINQDTKVQKKWSRTLGKWLYYYATMLLPYRSYSGFLIWNPWNELCNGWVLCNLGQKFQLLLVLIKKVYLSCYKRAWRTDYYFFFTFFLTQISKRLNVRSYYTTVALRCRYIDYFLPQVTAASPHFKLKMNLTFMRHRNAVTLQFLYRTVQCVVWTDLNTYAHASFSIGGQSHLTEEIFLRTLNQPGVKILQD